MHTTSRIATAPEFSVRFRTAPISPRSAARGISKHWATRFGYKPYLAALTLLPGRAGYGAKEGQITSITVNCVLTPHVTLPLPLLSPNQACERRGAAAPQRKATDPAIQ